MTDQTISLQPGDTLTVTVAAAAPVPAPAPSPAPDLATLQANVDAAIADVFTAFGAPAVPDIPPAPADLPADPAAPPAFTPNT